MKPVVFEKNTSTIDFEEINNEHIVGIQWSNGLRIMIACSQNGYIGVSNDDIRYVWERRSKKEYIEEARKLGCSVYVFSDYSELFKWMSEYEY